MRGVDRVPRARVGPAALACGYAATLVVVDAVLRAVSPDAGDAARDWASTNLDHLSGSPVRAVAVLVASAFLPESSAVTWAVLGAVGLLVTARALGVGRTVALVAGVHVVATLVSEGVLAGRIVAGDVDPVARSVLDVGPSFVVVAALVAGICAGRRWERLAPAVALGAVAPYLFTGLPDLDVAALGHAVSVVLGAAGAVLLLRRSRRAVAVP